MLDGDSPLCHISGMTKHIVKVDRTNRTFRIVIPQPIIQRWRWGNVDHVIVDDTNDDYLILRRLIHGEASPTESKRYSPG
jgi:bifunctional DNA-binding transcriptional regulator/antitoxin component of YhaV-PrlF toxin-antitoxin module